MVSNRCFVLSSTPGLAKNDFATYVLSTNRSWYLGNSHVHSLNHNYRVPRPSSIQVPQLFHKNPSFLALTLTPLVPTRRPWHQGHNRPQMPSNTHAQKLGQRRHTYTH
jgi:hypothetical protein